MDAVERAFAKLIKDQRGHHSMKMTGGNKQQFRLKYRRGTFPKKTTMKKYLVQAGIRIDDTGYSSQDMIEAIKFAIGNNEFARQLGAEYIFEKWRNRDNQQLSF